MALAYYAVQVKPSRETAVAVKIPREGFTVHCPVMHERRIRYGRMEEYAVHLFPGYIFSRWDNLIESYHHILEIPDVVKVLSYRIFDRVEPIAIPDVVMNEILHRDLSKPVDDVKQEFKIGQRVRIIDGPLQGLEVLFDGDGRKRSATLMAFVETIGRNKVRVELPKTSLAAA